MFNEPTDPYEDADNRDKYCREYNICPDCGENPNSPICCTAS